MSISMGMLALMAPSDQIRCMLQMFTLDAGKPGHPEEITTCLIHEKSMLQGLQSPYCPDQAAYFTAATALLLIAQVQRVDHSMYLDKSFCLSNSFMQEFTMSSVTS